MTASPHAERFKTLSTAEVRDVHTFAEDRLKILWVLAVAKDDPAISRLSASEISDILRDCAGINLPRQRIAGILTKEKATVFATTIDRRIFYKIMKAGFDEVSGSSPTIFVDPANTFSALRAVEEIIASLEGELRYCDTYVDRRTLDFLANRNPRCTIKLLTVNIYGNAAFSADLRAFEKEYPGKLAVRQQGQGELHDRYIVHEKGLLILGASLKDVGKKQSFVIALGKDISRSVTLTFDRHWNLAKHVS